MIVRLWIRLHFHVVCGWEVQFDAVARLELTQFMVPFVSPTWSLFIILSSRTISMTCFENGLALWKRTVRVSSEIVFFFIVVNKSFYFRHLCSYNGPLLAFIAYFSYNKDCYKFFPYWAWYISALAQMIFASADHHQ